MLLFPGVCASYAMHEPTLEWNIIFCDRGVGRRRAGAEVAGLTPSAEETHVGRGQVKACASISVTVGVGARFDVSLDQN